MGHRDYESEACSRASEGSNSASNGPASDEPSTRSRATRSAGESSRPAGRARPAGPTSKTSTPPSSRRPTCSSGGFRVRDAQSRTQPRELACMILAAASGNTWGELRKQRAQLGSWSRTWRTVGEAGFPVCDETWDSKAMRRFRSVSKHATLACGMSVPASSCLPTPTASAYGSSNNGSPLDGRREQYATKGKPSLWSMASSEGGTLNYRFSLCLMGFPEGWLDLPSGRSGTPLFPNAQRSLDT